ncbi:MAG: PIN domain nuclease, partial [Candidatus Saccharibacteria bacterium]|nr:PIN domain nuclease [Candidatus Saccharibacteria bacterium]
MAVTGWLIDKSALVRLGSSPDAKLWALRITAGVVHLSSITRLEIGYSARSSKELVASINNPPISTMPIELLSPAIEERAWEVLRELARVGKHRAPLIPDLLLAATAEKCGLTILHVDKDFELISKVTGQPQERLVYS